MATKYPAPNLVGDEGVDYVALECSRAGALFLQRPRQDIGIDGHIEILNDSNEPTGQLALVQCKSGMSFISATGAYVLRADQAHFETWSRYFLPVIGIVYNPVARDARWSDLTAHIREHPACVASGPFSVEAPSAQVFGAESFRLFRDYLKRYIQETSAAELIGRYLGGANDAAREEALTALFARERWGLHCCFVVHAALQHETSPRLVRLLVYLQSFYRPHPDRFYNEKNAMPCSARDQLVAVARLWTSSLQEKQILRMLEAIDPEGNLERGSFGQLVMLLLEEVHDIQRKLERIVSSRTVARDARCYGLGMLVELGLARQRLLERLYRDETDAHFLEIISWGFDRLRGA